jgi:hypothetical protein
MPIETTAYTERVLIVLNPDGTFKGGHSEAVAISRDGATVLAVMQMPPVPLTEATLATVLAPASAALAAQVAALKATIAAHVAEIAAANAARDQADAGRAAAEQQRDAEAVARDAAATEAAGLRAEVARLNALLTPMDAAGFPVLTAVQIRLGLLGAGVAPASVDAAIAAIPDAGQREAARAYWEYSTSYRRSHLLVASLAGALGLADAQVDALWRAAAEIE